ncbi:putative bifunctional diguanylate cyclase/phosphodiesterase [Intestinimonas butyriciproducens]|uniref:putative bifunctional diguanylate cyclase/phosphodiesterase n=1 Tax=Intestinimonas butyriciproducens TaxID=1297617 RepID=UPI0018AB83DF|nr:bifunctional diguanylate cyclase/phosphodiesterase [Intestinimonas butyriciproducens]MDB7818038.1 bifunctional diguanylate cyclase/phosphodiesterase [Intestinimonas butyriciproducens]MDB7844425.1 bifunctional diguanylate cyclase/phosphodiesterase [Intestinimonas butyriciproducens]MDB7858906.1 bifunctional diguanylate cyclase/phosphodiesterase [Intestinimonas butyriciproducens]
MVKWSLAAELLAAMMIVVLMVYYREKKLAVTRKGKVYRSCLGLSLATVLLNAVCVYTIEHTEQVPRAVNLILNSAYFLAAVLTCSVIVLYLCYLILEHVYDKRHLRRALLCISGGTLGYLLLVLWNLSSGVLFSFDPGGNYRRGPLNRIGYALMAAELLLLAVCYVQNRASVNRPMVKLMHTLPPLAIFLAAFQLAYPQVLLNGMMMAMADLILFISFQSSRIETDGLTGIGNRNSFFAELSLRVAGRQQFQIVLLSLQQFVTINQRFGHQRGDAFLYEVARYLDGLCRQARAFRFGNVEFAVVFPWRGETEATDNLQKLRERFQRNWRLGEVETRLTARFAELICTGQSWSPTQIIEGLEYGLRLAKAGPEDTVRFNERTAALLEKERMLVNIMRRSVLERRFQVWYQPIYDCQSGAFTSAEALLRLQDYEGNMISPAEFIPLAEETGLIGELSWIVLEGTCRLLGSGRAPDLRSVSINLSMQQFAEQELISRIVDSLDRNGVPHDRLKVEITERVLLQDMDRMRTAMAEMASRDIHFYLDDFGTGYSNLSCVLDLPFECVKLDQSLVAEFPDDQRADLLVRTLVSLFHNMGLQVVAEGVEAAPQAEALARYGADRIQGYYYARPMPESELIPFLKEKNHAPQGGAKEVLV